MQRPQADQANRRILVLTFYHLTEHLRSVNQLHRLTNVTAFATINRDFAHFQYWQLGANLLRPELHQTQVFLPKTEQEQCLDDD